MYNWEVLAAAIPRGSAHAIASGMRKRGYKCSDDLVRRWMREQTSDENLEATGQASPLDKCSDLIEVFVVDGNRQGAGLIVNQINTLYHRIAYPGAVFTLNGHPERAASQLLQQCSHAVDSLISNGITRETVFRLHQLQQTAVDILACSNQDLLRAESQVSGPKSQVFTSCAAGGVT